MGGFEATVGPSRKYQDYTNYFYSSLLYYVCIFNV